MRISQPSALLHRLRAFRRTSIPLYICCLSAALGVSPVGAAGTWERAGLEILETTEGEGVSARVVKLEPKSRDLPPVEAHIIVFKPQEYTLRVVDDPEGAFKNLREAMEKVGAVAGVNGGYFHKDNRPLGLVVSGGQVIHEQETAKLLSGVVTATEANLQMLRPRDFTLNKGVLEALQAGPFLVDGGKPVAGLNADKVSRRTVVVQLADGRWALAALSPVTLAQAGQLLAMDLLWPGSQTDRALNLDGGSSSAFYLRPPAGSRPVYLSELSQVRNYLALQKR